MADTTLAPIFKSVPGPRAGQLRRVLCPDWQLGWVLVSPVVVIVTALLIYPFIDAILLSFQERFIGKTGTWVGLANYAALFSDTTPPWAKAAVTTLLVTGGAVGIKFVIGMTMACVLNQDLPARNLLRGIM